MTHYHELPAPERPLALSSKRRIGLSPVQLLRDALRTVLCKLPVNAQGQVILYGDEFEVLIESMVDEVKRRFEVAE